MRARSKPSILDILHKSFMEDAIADVSPKIIAQSGAKPGQFTNVVANPRILSQSTFSRFSLGAPTSSSVRLHATPEKMCQSTRI